MYTIHKLCSTIRTCIYFCSTIEHALYLSTNQSSAHRDFRFLQARGHRRSRRLSNQISAHQFSEITAYSLTRNLKQSLQAYKTFLALTSYALTSLTRVSYSSKSHLWKAQWKFAIRRVSSRGTQRQATGHCHEGARVDASKFYHLTYLLHPSLTRHTLLNVSNRST